MWDSRSPAFHISTNRLGILVWCSVTPNIFTTWKPFSGDVLSIISSSADYIRVEWSTEMPIALCPCLRVMYQCKNSRIPIACCDHMTCVFSHFCNLPGNLRLAKEFQRTLAYLLGPWLPGNGIAKSQKSWGPLLLKRTSIWETLP